MAAVDLYSDPSALADVLEPFAKKFAFQKEKSETGYVHWQVRLSLIKKTTQTALFRDIIPNVPGNWSLTSASVHNAGNTFNYML